MFSLYGLITFDLSIQELKKLLSSRNESFSFNMMQDLDQRLENRISGLKSFGQLEVVKDSLRNSNTQFQKIENVAEFITLKEKEFDEEEQSYFAKELDKELSKELKNTINFYKKEYNFDVIEEFFVTNMYGVNIATGKGVSDFIQSDEEWWQITKEQGIYYGELEFDSQYSTSIIPLGFRISDDENNFLGVLHVSLSLNDILEDFDDEAELINNEHRNVILLDKYGQIIFSRGPQNQTVSVPYFDKLAEWKDVGFFELEDNVDDIKLVSFAKSTGYKSFEGFDWVVVIEQDSSSFVNEFIDMRNSMMIISFVGIIFSVILGLVITKLVANPLRSLASFAKSVSKGDFSVKPKHSSISEFQTINNSFEKMSKSLEKLIETEKKLAETQAIIKNERFRAIGELAANLAHDLKNPLGTIKSSSDIIRRSQAGKDPELKEFFNRMDRGIDRISHQIQDVLNFVRTTPLDLSHVSLRNIIKTSIDSLNIPENISIKIPENFIEIECDERKMEVLFTNIILNAVQAIGKDIGTIEIKLKEKDKTIQIEIIDSGKGVPEEALENIFEPLFTTKEQGTGLGLSSCKNIVEQHGGKIEVKNNPTTFKITLPKKQG